MDNVTMDNVMLRGGGGSNNQKTLVMFNTHKLTPAIMSEFQKMQNCGVDCVLMINNGGNAIEDNDKASRVQDRQIFDIKVKCVLVYLQDLEDIGFYTFDGNIGYTLWYNADYYAILGRKYFKDYDFYWSIDYDCFLNAPNYKEFFDFYKQEDTDLIVSHLRKESFQSKWCWIPNITWAYETDEFVHGSLFSIARYSGRLLDVLCQERKNLTKKFLDFKGKKQWLLCELFTATEAAKHGFSMRNFTSDGHHIGLSMYDLNQQRFFTKHDNKMYHPVKEDFVKRNLASLQKQLTQKDSELQSKNQALDLKIKELESLKSQYDSKIKELQVNLKTAQDTLSSLPTKKQTLEIKNLESDLKIKELKAKQIEKELGYSYNAIKEAESLKQRIKDLESQNQSLKLNQLDSKTKELESKNTGLESNLNYPIFKGNLSYLNTMTSAKDRIHNHLSYKLGKAMIENSKSILGYIRMPYVLSYIKEQHNKEQKQYQEQIKKNPNLKLPKLESYKDYKETLKEKECFTYKLGEALMKADKTWYKGGYVKLWFEAKRLKREYREKRRG